MSITFYLLENPENYNEFEQGSMEDLTLNIANGNFQALMFALGINIKPENDDPIFGISYSGGGFDPRLLIGKLENIIPELAIRNETQDRNLISCALRIDQIERYVSKLKEICEVAMKTEKMIYWG